MPKKPTDTLTWKKDNNTVTIDHYIHETILIDKTTGKVIVTMQEVKEIPPITRKRKHKLK